MNDDPYAALGIDRNATPDEVRKAHRQGLLRHHPDRGGDAESHRIVSEAGELLSDPQRRARFDATGDRGGPPRQGPEAELLSVLVPCLPRAFQAMLEQGERPERGNVVAFMRRVLERDRAELKKNLKKYEEARATLEASAKRFQEPVGEEPLLAAAARHHVEAIDAQVRLAVAEEARIGKALEYLARCGYEFAPRVGGAVGFGAAGFWGMAQ